MLLFFLSVAIFSFSFFLRDWSNDREYSGSSIISLAIFFPSWHSVLSNKKPFPFTSFLLQLVFETRDFYGCTRPDPRKNTSRGHKLFNVTRRAISASGHSSSLWNVIARASFPVPSLVLSTLIVLSPRTKSHDDTILVFYPINNKKPFRVVLIPDRLESLTRRSLRATLVPRSSARSSHSRSAEQTAQFSLLIESVHRISK